MTFLRTSASCTPSNFGTPIRLGAASAAVGQKVQTAHRVNSRPAKNARQPVGTLGAVVVTRQHSSIRKVCFSRTPRRPRPIEVFALLVGLGCATAGRATPAGAPRVVFDQTSQF